MNNLKGYTLVEVLIVMSLFSLISLLSLTFLNTSVSSSIGISSKSKLLNELAVFSELLEDDLFHVAKQFPRPSQIDQFPSFFKLNNNFRDGEPLLELVRNSSSDGLDDLGAGLKLPILLIRLLLKSLHNLQVSCSFCILEADLLLLQLLEHHL